jgi:hypothetical protein
LQGAAKHRGPPRSAPNLALQQITELVHAIAKATAREERAEFIIDAQMKFLAAFGRDTV